MNTGFFWLCVCVCCNVVEQSCGVGTRIQDIRSNVMEAFLIGNQNSSQSQIPKLWGA